MSDQPQKYTVSNYHHRFIQDADTDYISYSDYDPEDGPVYVIETDKNDNAWIQTTHPVNAEP